MSFLDIQAYNKLVKLVTWDCFKFRELEARISFLNLNERKSHVKERFATSTYTECISGHHHVHEHWESALLMLQHNAQNEWKNHTTTEELKVTGTEPKREIGSGLAKGENSNCAKKLTGESKLSLSAPFFCADSIWNYSKGWFKRVCWIQLHISHL